MAQEPKAHWIQTTVRLYGKKVKLWYQTVDALWYPSAGQQLLRIVLVRDPSGRRHDDCFFSLDLTLTAPQILELFSRRWPLEVCFRDVKQFLGFEDPQNRVAQATTRTAPLIFYIYDLVLLWYAQVGYRLTANSVLDVCGTCKRHRFLLRTFFEPYVTRPGRRGFSATPLWMPTPENSSNPLWNGQKHWRKNAKP